MKKYTAIILIIALVLGLAGCSGQNAATDEGTLPIVQSPSEKETPEITAGAETTAGKTTAAPVTTDAPATEAPTTGEPATEEPATEEPTTENLTTAEPATEETTTEESDSAEWTIPIWTEPTTAEPTPEETTAPEPVTEEPTTPEPVTEPPETEPPATEPPATEPPETEPPVTEPPATEPPATEPPATEPPAGNAPLVCIDPGHQATANEEQEPVAPGSSDTKAKVADGTHGITTGIRESVVNLEIALMLRDELIARGYRVLMTRTSEDVNISNIERAQMANEAGADAFLRLHCDYGDYSSSGISIFCQHPYSDYNGFQYENSRRLSELVLANMCRVTGAPNLGVTEAYHYSGINWSKVPGGLIEMGFMSNPTEEQRLLDPAYRQLLVQGMADGLDAYFGR